MVDSDDEWEEEEPGESLSHSEVVPSCASVYCHATHTHTHTHTHTCMASSMLLSTCSKATPLTESRVWLH